MGEGVDVEVGPEIPVRPQEEVAIECRRDAKGIVVGKQQIALTLDEIGADEQRIARGQRGPDVSEKSVRPRRIEVADVRAEKEREGAAGGQYPRADLSADFGESGLVRRLVRHDSDVGVRLDRAASGFER